MTKQPYRQHVRRVPNPIPQDVRDATKEAFTAAVHQLRAKGVTLGEVARSFERSSNYVARWMMGSDYRMPPPYWRDVLARLAEEVAARRVEAAQREAAELQAIGAAIRSSDERVDTRPAGI